ncbi:putative GntR family transcriptional regulator [Gordonia hirsuta DSM 44140 = NBRC 16056]|uniref:Putative GntR family transcriptional regulator n=1 Tax=Gordonia hirsuta DSM 44140 = NBRC 16056 TaxID=1121927 RepID=L7L801_9ACTN|nr:GntR family transcriptional regulator [Gordonia hirsuta]GAC57029.1 putative GntR family transcriptional regulator [Gordonia hirsuta DSM 44140 = NBRC 16056]
MSKTYSAAERVYDEVKEAILTCELPGGELISEGEVAERCQVSRTPVREAFLRLAAEGWMRLYPKRGALIVPVGERESREVLEARLLVECHAVRDIVARPAAIGPLVDRLRANLALLEGASGDDFARIDTEFHQLIVEAGRNSILQDFFTSLGERRRRMTAASMHRDAGVTARIQRDHIALADAVAAGDADLFARLLREHLAGVHEVVEVDR